MPNVHRPDLDEQGDANGFRWRGERVGLKAGAERLGASVYVVPPGDATFPYHYHLANEELLIVLSGARTCARRRAGAGSRRARWSRFRSAIAGRISS